MKAVPAFGNGIPLDPGPLDEVIVQGSSRHAHGALYDDDVLLLCLNIGLFEADIRVAFLRGHETGSDLDAGAAQGEIVENVLMGEDAAGKYHRNVLLIFFCVFLYDVQDFQDLLIVARILMGLHLLRRITQVAARLGALDHHQVRSPLIMLVPAL